MKPHRTSKTEQDDFEAMLLWRLAYLATACVIGTWLFLEKAIG